MIEYQPRLGGKLHVYPEKPNDEIVFQKYRTEELVT